MSTNKRKLALVEDSPDTAELFSEFLDRMCDTFEVSRFSNGFAFLDTFRRGVYAVVILDISLPDMNGFEVLRRMRLIDEGTPTIAFTAHGDITMRKAAAEAGFRGFVTKPVGDLDKFCRVVVDAADQFGSGPESPRI
jgi:DNA-binding response OmpR family regulator